MRFLLITEYRLVSSYSSGLYLLPTCCYVKMLVHGKFWFISAILTCIAVCGYFSVIDNAISNETVI